MRLLAIRMLEMVESPDRSVEEMEAYIADHEILFHQQVFDAAGSEFASRFHNVLADYFHESYGSGPHGTPRISRICRITSD